MSVGREPRARPGTGSAPALHLDLCPGALSAGRSRPHPNGAGDRGGDRSAPGPPSRGTARRTGPGRARRGPQAHGGGAATDSEAEWRRAPAPPPVEPVKRPAACRPR
jgi:hypothetical protein